jgi:hypothetical protein
VFEVQILTGNFTKARQVRIYSVETPFLIRRRNSHARTSLDSKTRELERDSFVLQQQIETGQKRQPGTPAVEPNN